ncbi:MAG: Mu transposase domain-containing protein [Culicoidibacterales bacterium]
MVSYKSCQYSLPTAFIGKQLILQIYDNKIHIFYKQELICSHDITQNRSIIARMIIKNLSKQIFPTSKHRINLRIQNKT